MDGMGWGWVWGCRDVPCTHACTCMLNMINMDASMLTAICNFYTCVCVYVHVCACMCMFVQGLSIPFACVGSSDPVRVLHLYTMNTLDIL